MIKACGHNDIQGLYVVPKNSNNIEYNFNNKFCIFRLVKTTKYCLDLATSRRLAVTTTKYCLDLITSRRLTVTRNAAKRQETRRT